MMASSIIRDNPKVPDVYYVDAKSPIKWPMMGRN